MRNDVPSDTMFTVIHVCRLPNKCPLSRALKSKALLIKDSDAGITSDTPSCTCQKKSHYKKRNFNQQEEKVVIPRQILQREGEN